MASGAEEFQGGDRLAGFQIISLIGRGGMGSVYLAEDERLRRRVALKVILPEFASQESFRRRFETEARGAAAIEHPNLVPIFSAGSAEGHLYLAMRHIEGENLNQALDRHGPLQADQGLQITNAVAAGLDAAHAAGLVHRDVTPANILLEGELGRDGIYLTDFGLVRHVDSEETRLTRTDQVIANLDYAAPEQIQGGRIDARTDVYALGCVIYRMRAGKRPFPGTDTQKMWKIVNDPLPSIGNGEEPLDEVIARATAKDPAHRYPSAGDLARAAAEPDAAKTQLLTESSVATGLAAAGYHEGDTSEMPEAPKPLVDPPGGESPTEVVGNSTAVGTRRRRRLLAIGTSTAAILAGAVVAVVLIAGNGDKGAPTVVRETVTETTEAPVSSTDEIGGEAAPSSPAEREPSRSTANTSSLPGLEEFTGGMYYGLAPVGWEQELIDKPVTDYYENLWRDPSDPESTFIRIDGGSPQEEESPFAASEGLVEEVRQSPGYREISYEPDFKSGREAARWVYEIDGDKRADFFFVECGQGLASVGSTSPGRYPELAAMFREVAFSTKVYCD